MFKKSRNIIAILSVLAILISFASLPQELKAHDHCGAPQLNKVCVHTSGQPFCDNTTNPKVCCAQNCPPD